MGGVNLCDFLTRVETFSAGLENSETGDLNEPAFAEYLKRNMFDVKGGILRAAWCSGVGAVPLGFTTYAPNAIEVSHRALKHLLDHFWVHRDVATLMADVCDAVESRMFAGSYDKLHRVLQKAQRVLLSTRLSRSSSRFVRVFVFSSRLKQLYN